VEVGGPNPFPNGQTDTTINLEAGQYAVICFVGSSGVPHFMKGMVRGLKVTAGSETAPEPTSDATVTLTDYTFSVRDL
jgi:hypothetical protein